MDLYRIILYMTDYFFSSTKKTDFCILLSFCFAYRRCNKVLNHAPFPTESFFSSFECATLGSTGVLCRLSVYVCVCVHGVSGVAAVGLHGQLSLQVFNNILQALPSFPLLLKLLSQLLTISFRLLQLHMQLLNLHNTAQDRQRSVSMWQR